MKNAFALTLRPKTWTEFFLGVVDAMGVAMFDLACKHGPLCFGCDESDSHGSATAGGPVVDGGMIRDRRRSSTLLKT